MSTKNKPSGIPFTDKTVGERSTLSVPKDSVPAAATASDTDVADFVAQMKSLAPSAGPGRGRLLFAMDATMSRQSTWDMALNLQAGMFQAVKDVGGLDVQLVFFRGNGECRASKWVSDPDQLARVMTTVACRGGFTQIGKVLSHAKTETEERRVNAMVYVGDAMEENVDALCAKAGELALLGLPLFLFQEGHNPDAARAFKELARLTKGAYCRFDAGSAQQLRDLLTAVAVYAAGGQKALLVLSGRKEGHGAKLLLTELKRGD